MSKTSKLTPIVIGGVGIASGAMLAAWLLTGTRKAKTKKIISRGKASLQKSFKKKQYVFEESDSYYI